MLHHLHKLFELLPSHMNQQRDILIMIFCVIRPSDLLVNLLVDIDVSFQDGQDCVITVEGGNKLGRIEGLKLEQ